MSQSYFVTGTDTDIGKTWSTLALMRCLQRNGFSVLGMKPVAAGCVWQDGGWRNQDALSLQAKGSRQPGYDLINPYAFPEPISPHLACGATEVSTAKIIDCYLQLAEQVDVVLVEGAGGWYSPLSGEICNAELAACLKLPVILVVGLRLGCINHALLTARAIQQQGLACAGWIAVAIDADMPFRKDNIAYLQQHIQAPLLGELPHQPRPDFDRLADCLSLPSKI